MSVKDAHAEARLPVRDLNRAQAWYADKLELHPVGARPGHLIYRLADGTFCLFTSAGASEAPRRDGRSRPGPGANAWRPAPIPGL
jgi:catechol 2,3-dioxygenase-like lactoylglutathione lyase family enzyme